MRHLVLATSVFLLLGLAVAPVAAKADHPPGVLHASLLNALKLDFDSHELWIDRFTCTFLPQPTKPTSSVWPYNPDDGEALEGVIRDAKDRVVLRYGFYANEQGAPYWVVHNYKILQNETGTAANGKRVKIAPGAYTLELLVGGEAFYRFPFQVTEVASDDAFAPQPYRFLQGDWSNWGYLFYPQANREMSIYFKLWLRIEGRTERKSARPTMEVFRGDTRVAVSSENMEITLRPEWNRFDLQLQTPPDAPPNTGRYLKAKDILDHDGSYRIDVALDGKPYGTWRFEVKAGQLLPRGRSVRGTADPLTFVEGGRDAFWYERDT